MTDPNSTSRMHSDMATRRVRVTLRYIEILDSKDIDTVGEFRFRFMAGVPERGDVVETRIPEDEDVHIAISEHPATNRLNMATVLFEGDVGPGESLLVEATGEEVDRFTPNDPIAPYRRVFSAPLDAVLGEHGPWDERGEAALRISRRDGVDAVGIDGARAGDGGDGREDPEQLADWRFAYVIEAVGDPVHPIV